MKFIFPKFGFGKSNKIQRIHRISRIKRKSRKILAIDIVYPMDENYQQNIKNFTNEKLCEIVVSNRYLGILREEALVCMSELAYRREQGSIFPYEEKINELFISLPKIDLDIKTILKTNPLKSK